MVAEFFLTEDISLGAIAGGGRYERLTDFIDKKHSFSWVWLSVSNRVMEIILDMKAQIITDSETYFFVNFADTLPQTLSLLEKFVSWGRRVELSPISSKLTKQFEYADKKWCRYAVILWSGELEKNSYLIKDLQTGQTSERKLSDL